MYDDFIGSPTSPAVVHWTFQNQNENIQESAVFPVEMCTFCDLINWNNSLNKLNVKE